MTKSIYFILLSLTCIGMPGSVWGQFAKPHVYIGASVGGGLSAIINQNTYGFPEMDYKPAVAYQFGIHAGLAVRPWSRLQIGYQFFNATYKFNEEYSSGSTEGEIGLRKQIEFSLINIPLTYRHYIIDPDLAYVGNDKTIALALKKKNTLFIIVGPQITRFRKADVHFQKRSSATGFKWQPADLIDIKPGFDTYVPVDEIPDYLPDDTRDLFQKTILSLIGGLGWNMVLAPGFEISMEAQGYISIMDLNSSERDQQNRYIWRRQIYSGTDPESYFPSTLFSLTLNAGVHYTF